MIKFLFFIFIFNLTIIAETFDSYISIDNKYSNRYPLDKKNDGAFIEFLLNWINGPTGMWAQEFLDRGFDDERYPNNLIRWRYVNNKINGEVIVTKLDTYNENGNSAVKLISNGGLIGVEQQIYNNDSIPLEIYVYSKSNDKNSTLNISVCDLNMNELYSKEFSLTSEYKKYSIVTPVFSNNHEVIIRFSTDVGNTIFIDEASAMPINNVNGVRKEFYDIFKLWSPGILRYPGGWFADEVMNQLENGIGPIDKRKSPNIDGQFYERMDFGYKEYFTLVRSLNIEPHIVVNFKNGTAEKAANIVEYFNGNENTEYGKKRIENGTLNSYNVKYVEVGNEQWSDIVTYAQKLKEFYSAIKAKDSNVVIIADGDIWQGYDYYLRMDSISNGSFDIYGYHPGMVLDTNKVNSGNETIKLGYLGIPTAYEYFNEKLKGIIDSLENKHKIAVTEWSHFLFNLLPQYNDLTKFSSQFQYGLFTAQMINMANRHSDYFVMNEKTAHIGSIQREISTKGERFIYPKPPVIVSNFINQHIGTEVCKTDVLTEKYNAYGFDDMLWLFDVPFIDVTTTISEDSVFVHIINRSVKDSSRINISSNIEFNSEFFKLYQFYSESLEAVLNKEDLNSFIKEEQLLPISNQVTLPPHSFSILAFPAKNLLSVEKNDNLLINRYLESNELIMNIKEKINNIDVFDLKGQKLSNYKIKSLNPLNIIFDNNISKVVFIKLFAGNKIICGKIVIN